MDRLKFIQVKQDKAPDNAGSSGSCCAGGNGGESGPLQFRTGSGVRTDSLYEKTPYWIKETIQTPSGTAYRVSTELTFSDYWGGIKSRVSAFRMKYSVKPGLYAVGRPDEDSDVLVTANYKLSFDKLRAELKGLNLWIIVLDTKGINVWCAAGKGVFGTDELVRRILDLRLDRVVRHRRIILPQLSAPGVRAGAVRQKTGFRVFFGPVYARDIREYIERKYKATPEMRLKEFTMTDRLVLTPMELNPAMKKFPVYALAVLIIFGLEPSGIIFRDAWVNGMPFLVFGLISIFAGAFITPVFLPFIPFRSFALKGWIAGVVIIALSLHSGNLPYPDNNILLLTVYLFFPVMSSYIALQFTGSTTFTGISGVKKELKTGIPVYLTAAAVSAVLLIIYKINEWGLYEISF